MRLWWLAPEEQNGPPPTYQLERKEPSLSAPSAPMMRGTRFIGHGYYKFPSSTHPVNTDFTGKCPWRHFLYEALSPTVFSVILIIFYNGFDSACLWRFSCSPFITLAWWGQHIYLFSILGEKKKIEGKWKKEKKKKMMWKKAASLDESRCWKWPLNAICQDVSLRMLVPGSEKESSVHTLEFETWPLPMGILGAHQVAKVSAKSSQKAVSFCLTKCS